VIRKRGGSLQVQVFTGRDPSPAANAGSAARSAAQTKAAWREAKKVEAQLLEQLDRGEQRGSRTRTVAELGERWLEWRQQVRPSRRSPWPTTGAPSTATSCPTSAEPRSLAPAPYQRPGDWPCPDRYAWWSVASSRM
jgi:hypothetical protein